VKSTIASPRRSSGREEAACWKPGEAATAIFSTTSSEIISPATLAKRLTRPRMKTNPSSSISTTSPVSCQPGPNSECGGTSTPGFS